MMFAARPCKTEVEPTPNTLGTNHIAGNSLLTGSELSVAVSQCNTGYTSTGVAVHSMPGRQLVLRVL